MGLTFDPNEIFQIAVRIEVNGEKFYRAMAAKINDREVANLFTLLADDEVGHRRFYEELLEPPGADSIGKDLRARFHATVDAVLEVTESKQLLDKNPVIRRSIEVRNPYVDPINVLQAEILRLFRRSPDERLHCKRSVTRWKRRGSGANAWLFPAPHIHH